MYGGCVLSDHGLLVKASGWKSGEPIAYILKGINRESYWISFSMMGHLARMQTLLYL